MYLISFCLLLLWHSVQIYPHPFGASSLKPRAVVASHALTRVRVPSSSSSSSSSDVASNPGQLVDNARRSRYLLPVEVEGKSFYLEIDTGSSDTWIIQTGFDCYDTFDTSTETFFGSEIVAVCNFGPTYTPGRGFELVPDVYQETCYGQVEDTNRCVAGDFGFASVTFGGFTVKDQLIGAPSQSSYPAQGKPEQSGILGLAFSNITNAYDGTTGESVPYASIMYNLFDSGVTPSNVFALALSRDNSNNGNGGLMTIGGIPSLTDPAVNVSSDVYTSAPIEFVATRSLDEATFYAISVDALLLGTQKLNSGLQVILDSGAPSFQVPTDTAVLMNSYWSPPIDDIEVLACNAVLTKPIGVAIGGANYYIPSQDLIGKNSDGSCFSWIFGSDGDELLIGDAFLKSVLVVFDWDNLVTSFYHRPHYES